MMKSLKNKKGFTLIELLVVIGILAVLAAIAIPSVAGLIDRANKSADQTNANEMTNAIERFTSEYELVKQDIASGTFDEYDLDSVQGRVFNTFGISERRQITHLETDDGYNGYGLGNKSNYPVNEKTVKKVITNYIKTSSTTFLPKESDCSYFYSPELGKVIVAETGTASVDLDAIAQIEEGASVVGVPEGKTVQWIDISMNERLSAAGEEETNCNVALDKNTYTTLRNDIAGYMEFATMSGGLFVPGTNTYIKINVNGEEVDANWLNLIRGEYIQVVGGSLHNGPKAAQMHGEMVICKEINDIASVSWTGSADDDFFLKNTNVTSVILEEGVTSIGDYAFRKSNIEKIYIPSTVSHIGNSILSRNYTLKTIELSANNPYFELHEGALYTEDFSELIKYPQCDAKTSYTTHPNTKKIRSHAFVGCQNLQTVYFSDGITSAGGQIFDGVGSLRDAYINDSCIFNGRAPFRNNYSLTLHVNPTNRNYQIIDGVLYTYDLKHAIAIGTQPTGIVKIVEGCEKIQDITGDTYQTMILPVSLKKIYNDSLYGNLKYIYYAGTESQFNAIVMNNATKTYIEGNVEITYGYTE